MHVHVGVEEREWDVRHGGFWLARQMFRLFPSLPRKKNLLLWESLDVRTRFRTLGGYSRKGHIGVVVDIILTILGGMDVEAIVSSEQCGWEYAQGIIQVQTLFGGGNNLLPWCP